MHHALLAALTDFDDDTLLALIEEALRARVLEETGAPGEYRFTHALMQDALYSELSTARRVRMHGRVAETLEALHGDSDGRAGRELARHFGEAARDEPLVRREGRAVRGLAAAEQAESRFAWGDVSRHFGKVIELLEHSAGATSPLAHAHFGVARSSSFGGALDQGRTHLSAAAELFSQLNDPVLFAEVAYWAVSTAGGRDLALGQRGLAAVEGSGNVVEGKLLAMLASYGVVPEARALDRAQEIESEVLVPSSCERWSSSRTCGVCCRRESGRRRPLLLRPRSTRLASVDRK